MLPPSLTISLSQLAWLKRTQHLQKERWILAKNQNHLECTRGVGRPRIGTTWYQSVPQTLSNIKHNLNIEFPAQAVHAQTAASRAVHKALDQKSWYCLNLKAGAKQWFDWSATSYKLVGHFFDRPTRNEVSLPYLSSCTLVHLKSTAGRVQAGVWHKYIACAFVQFHLKCSLR